MIVKEHRNHHGQIVLAICDEDIIGKKRVEGNKQLDLACNFYKGEKKTENEIYDMIKKSYLINAVGTKAINLLRKHNLIKEEQIITIDNIPHIQLCIITD